MKESIMRKFPEGFYWGAATASYQVEGGIENNDWAEAAQLGRIPAAGQACDGYNRYTEDFEIAKSLNHNAHRFSIEWARIEPEEGKFDEEEIEHYRQVIRTLRERGLEPFVTLWHFTLPLWFSKIGGFENPRSPEIFSRYCEYVVSRLGDRVKYWITINEPNVYNSHGYLKGVWPPFKKNIFKFIKVQRNLITSHNVGYKKIKRLLPNVSVGIAQNVIFFESNYNPINHLLSRLARFFWNSYFINKISKYQDFIGINHYHRHGFGVKRDLPRTEYLNWEIYPDGFYAVLMELKRFNLPVFVTENGLADSRDVMREKFIREYLFQIWRAIQHNVDVRGYFHWSLIDNFEWAHGFGPRFGLVEIDYDTLKRKIRPSAYKYAKICKENALTM